MPDRGWILMKFNTRKFLCASSFLFLLIHAAFAVKKTYVQKSWAKEQLSRMCLDEKIGQLFMVSASSTDSKELIRAIETAILSRHLGGLIFMGGEALPQSKLVNRYQKRSFRPLLISQDAERGFEMRLKDVTRFPSNLALGAINDKYSHLFYQFGQQIANQGKLLGVHIGFAPVLDISNNPNYPVSFMRSFGGDPKKVALRGTLMIKGMQEGGLIATAKHFPGIGDTMIDPHIGLPIVLYTRQRLEHTELVPFKSAIENKVGAIMPGHVAVTSLEPDSELPCTLSRSVMTDFLQKELGFKGLLITDSMIMGGLTTKFSLPEACVKALLAGNHILLIASGVSITDPKGSARKLILDKHLPDSIAAIKKALHDKVLTQKQLDNAVLKILETKERLGLNKKNNLSTLSPLDQINTFESKALTKEMFHKAITLVQNKEHLLPLKSKVEDTVHIQMGKDEKTLFSQTIETLTGCTTYAFSTIKSFDRSLRNILELCRPQTVVISVYLPLTPSLFPVTEPKPQQVDFLREVGIFTKELEQKGHNVILVLFCSPFVLRHFGAESTILVAYEGEPDAQEAAALVIEGKLIPEGNLPVTVSHQFPLGTSVKL